MNGTMLPTFSQFQYCKGEDVSALATLTLV